MTRDTLLYGQSINNLHVQTIIVKVIRRRMQRQSIPLLEQTGYR